MRIASLDLGTNLFKIIVAQIIDNKIDIQFRVDLPVNMAKGGINNNMILPDAIIRAKNALKTIKENILNYYKPDIVLGNATSAVRSSTNGHLIMDYANEIGLQQLNVISGDREAELIYYGVKQATEMTANYDLLIDIGGGSTEFIIANNNSIAWKHSYNLGVTRLSEKFSPSDPILLHEIARIEGYLDDQLTDLYFQVQKYNCTRLIGATGSFDTIQEMVAHQYKLPAAPVYQHYEYIDIEQFRTIFGLLKSSTSTQRANMPGMSIMRVDHLTIGCILVDFVLQKTKINQLLKSDYAMNEGTISEYINKMSIV